MKLLGIFFVVILDRISINKRSSLEQVVLPERNIRIGVGAALQITVWAASVGEYNRLILVLSTELMK